jgi:hypothetical protein
MNGKLLRVSNEVYNEIENIRKLLIEKCSLEKDLSIRDTLDILWSLKRDDEINLNMAVDRIKKQNIAISWGNHGRGSKKYKSGQLNIKLN